MPGRQKEPVKGRIAETFGLRRPLQPRASQRAQERLARLANPQTRLGHEPIKLAQPLGSGLQPRVIEYLRLVGRARFALVQLPVLAGPKPKTLVAQTFSQQTQTHAIFEQLKRKLRHRGVRDA